MATLSIKEILAQDKEKEKKTFSLDELLGQEEKRKKGLGYFGKLKRPDGMVSTEYSIGITGAEFDWKETEVPSLVPTLTRDEITHVLSGEELTPEIIEKAKQHALVRIEKGLSPFAQAGEQRAIPGQEKPRQFSLKEITGKEEVPKKPELRERTWWEKTIAPIRSFEAGMLTAGARTARALDNTSKSLARTISNITGVPEEKLRGGVFGILEKDLDYYSERAREMGVNDIVGEVAEGLGGASWDIPSIMTFGKWGLPIHGALFGASEGGLRGAVEGAITGAFTHKMLGVIGILPSKARLPAFAGFGFAMTPGGVKERTAGGLTWAALGVAGYGKRKVTVREFMEKYPKIEIRIDNQKANRALKKLDPNLTDKEIKKAGGARRALDDVYRELWHEEARQIIESKKTTMKKLLVGDITPEQAAFLEEVDARIDAANKAGNRISMKAERLPYVGKRLRKRRIYNTVELAALEADISLKEVLNNADVISERLVKTGLSFSDMIKENKHLFRYLDKVEGRVERPPAEDAKTIKNTKFLDLKVEKENIERVKKEIVSMEKQIITTTQAGRAGLKKNLQTLEKYPVRYFKEKAKSIRAELDRMGEPTEDKIELYKFLKKEYTQYNRIIEKLERKHPTEIPLENRPYSLPLPEGETLRIVAQGKEGSMPVYQHEMIMLFKNFEGRVERLEKKVTKKEATGLFKNFIYVIEEFPELKKLLYDPIKLAENNIAKEGNTTRTRVTAWRLALKESPEHKLPHRKHKTLKESTERIALYAIEQQKGGLETLERMGKERVGNLDLTEQQVYNAVRADLEGIYKQINQTRRLAGLDPMPKVENYFTFFRNLEVLKEEGYNPIYDPDVGKLKIKLNAVPFEFARERGKDILPADLNFFEVYKLYRSKAMKFVHKSPVIAKGRALIENFDVVGIKETMGLKAGAKWVVDKEGRRTLEMEKGYEPTSDILPEETISIGLRDTQPRLYTILDKWLDHQVGGTIKATGKGARVVSRAVGSLNRNVAMWVLSWNFRSAFIQPTALRLSYIELGAKWLGKGVRSYMDEGKRNFCEKEANVILSRMFDVHAEEIFGMQVEKHLKGKYYKAKAEFGRVGMIPLQTLDLMAAKMTWLGAYEKAIAKKREPMFLGALEVRGGLGMSKAEAKIYADDTVTRTQASAAPSDIAPIQRTPWGKTASLFQTFVLNEWNYLYKNVAGLGEKATVRISEMVDFETGVRAVGQKGGTIPMTIAQRATQIGRVVFATAIVNAIYEKAFHLQSPYPSPELVLERAKEEDWGTWKTIVAIGREMGETLPIIGGSIRWSSAYRTAFPVIPQLGIDAITRINQIAMKPKPSQYDIDFVGKILGFPGGGQVMKYLRRRQKGFSHLESYMGVMQKGKKKVKGRKLFRPVAPTESQGW